MLSRLLAFSLICATSFAAITVETPEIRGIPVVRPSEAEAFALTLKNTGEARAAGHFTATLTPPSGRPVHEVEQAVALQPGESLRVAVALADAELGVWTVAHTFKSGASSAVSGSRRFVVMEPAGPNDTRPAFRFGVVSHTENKRDNTERQREISAAALIGAKTIRSNPSWWAIQPQPDIWRWELMDEMVDAFAADGIEMQVLLGYSVRWAVDPAIKGHGKDVLFAAPDLDAWRAYVAASVKRYQGRVRLWEVWNEPDLTFWRGTTEQYIALARVAIEEIRRADPAARIMTGGFATLEPHHARHLNPDLQVRVMREIGPLFDYHAVHEHGAFAEFARIVDGPLAELRAASPAPVPPLFFNETAITATRGADSERIQAEILVKKATFARARGAAGYLWYDLRNDGTDPANPEHNYGLVTRDFQPKPAYTAFNTHARDVVPRAGLRQLDAGRDRWLFLHGDRPDSSPPSLLLVAWNDDPGVKNEQLVLGVPGATRVLRMDLDGNREPLPLVSGNVTLALSERPCYLIAENAADIVPRGRLATPARAYFGGPGEEIEVECEFLNPLDRELRVTVGWTAPFSLRVTAPAGKTLVLPPLGKAASSLRVRLPEGGGYRFGRDARLRVDYAYEDAPFSGSLQIPVRFGVVRVPATGGADAEREADVTLSARDQLHSFVEADPTLTAHRWKGPADLGARVWFGRDDDALLLRVDVTDDRHHQTQQNPADLWREDSVQVVIDVPGGKGLWKLGFADVGGSPVTHIWERPAGASADIGLAVSPIGADGQGRRYLARIPRAALGLTDAVLAEGFRFNIAVNDHDGAMRAHALQLVPGIVVPREKTDAPFVLFR